MDQELMGKALEDIRKRIQENINLTKTTDEMLEGQVREEVERYFNGKFVSIKDKALLGNQIFSAIRGFGLLDTIINDDTVTEVMINGPGEIFIEKSGKLGRLEDQFESEEKLQDIIQRIVALACREVNQANPIVDTRLPDGSRVNVVLPPISLKGPIVTIRKFSKEPMTVEKLIQYGSLTPQIAQVLQLFVRAKYNIFICGGTGSGKTTFLNAISNFIPRDERVITIEDSAELQIANVDNLVRLETRNANTAGVGAVTMQEGGYASKSTIQFLNNWFDYTVGKGIRGKGREQLMDYLQGEIEQCIQKQNRLVYEYAREKKIRTGTTLTLLAMAEGKYITAQVGDSRAYCLGRGLRQLTEDQSVVAREVKAGRLSKEEAKHDKRRNLILQCIGDSENLQVAYGRGRAEAGEVFFLCSDGFVHELEDHEIKELLNPSLLVSRSAIKKSLIEAVSLVKSRGERDNITVVLVKAH